MPPREPLAQDRDREDDRRDRVERGQDAGGDDDKKKNTLVGAYDARVGGCDKIVR